MDIESIVVGDTSAYGDGDGCIAFGLIHRECIAHVDAIFGNGDRLGKERLKHAVLGFTLCACQIGLVRFLSVNGGKLQFAACPCFHVSYPLAGKEGDTDALDLLAGKRAGGYTYGNVVGLSLLGAPVGSRYIL